MDDNEVGEKKRKCVWREIITGKKKVKQLKVVTVMMSKHFFPYINLSKNNNNKNFVSFVVSLREGGGREERKEGRKNGYRIG